MSVGLAKTSGWERACLLVELLFQRLSTAAGRQECWNFLRGSPPRLLLPAPKVNDSSAAKAAPRYLNHAGIALLQPLGAGERNREEIFQLVQQTDTMFSRVLDLHLPRLRAALTEDWFANWRDRRQLRASLFLEIKVEAEPVGPVRRWQPTCVFRLRTRGGSEKLVPAPR